MQMHQPQIRLLEPIPLRRPAAAGARLIVVAVLLGLATVCAAEGAASGCPLAQRTLQFGFYAHFAPVSYSADPDPTAAGFDVHLG